MTGLLLLLAVGLALAWAGVTVATARVLTHPPRRTYASALARGRAGDPSELNPPLPFESWSLRSRGNDLAAWTIPGGNPAGPVFIITHGWGDSRIGMLSRAEVLRPYAASLVLWDLPGQGESQGSCTLGAREIGDLLALIDATPGKRLVLVGASLGAGLSIVAAGERKDRVSAVIAEAPYRLVATPARNMILAMRLPSRFTLPPALAWVGWRNGAGRGWPGFDRAEHAAKVACPLLVVHGDDDRISPPQDGREIAVAARHATFAPIPGGGHLGLWTEEPVREHTVAAVRAFLAAADITPAAAAAATTLPLPHS